MSGYIQSVKSIMDNLEVAANPVADFDLISTLLGGLSSEYDLFVTFVNARVDPILLEELIDLMLSQKIYCWHAITTPDFTTLIMVHTASYTPSYHSAPPSFSYSDRGHGRGSECSHHGCSFSPPHQFVNCRPQCQVCNYFSHYPIQCYNCYDDLSPSASPTALLHSSRNNTVDPN